LIRQQATDIVRMPNVPGLPSPQLGRPPGCVPESVPTPCAAYCGGGPAAGPWIATVIDLSRPRECSWAGSFADCRASAILARAQRREVRSNIWASLRSDNALPAFTLSLYASTAASLSRRLWEPRRHAARWQQWRAARQADSSTANHEWIGRGRSGRAPAVNSCARSGTRRGAACRALAAMLCRWLAFQRPGGADEPDQKVHTSPRG
jgi:hypothetical protein